MVGCLKDAASTLGVEERGAAGGALSTAAASTVLQTLHRAATAWCCQPRALTAPSCQCHNVYAPVQAGMVDQHSGLWVPDNIHLGHPRQYVHTGGQAQGVQRACGCGAARGQWWAMGVPAHPGSMQ